MDTRFNPQRGFRDMYPQDKALQDFLFETLKNVAVLFGFASYDGPILEDIQIYLNKTSKELVEKQTFQVQDKKDQTLILRPEMTPTLARMIAKKAGELTFPLRLFNLGLRFRYEAPQKGREREFYQADFDLLGSAYVLADMEILAVAIAIFLSLGASKNDFILYLNSRSFMEQKLEGFGIGKKDMKTILNLIDKQDKIDEPTFMKLLQEVGIGSSVINDLQSFLTKPLSPAADPYFTRLFSYLKNYGIDSYCQINPNIVRGLDYYTGLVFEVKEKGGTMRALLGGGRDDNLVSSFDSKLSIPGVGFATSDVVLMEFLKEKGLIPKVKPNTSQVLITVLGEDMVPSCVEIAKLLRSNGISCELYPSSNRKLDKQLKYADRQNIPFAIILGPEETQKGIVKVKDMKTREQKEVKKEEVVKILKS